MKKKSMKLTAVLLTALMLTLSLAACGGGGGGGGQEAGSGYKADEVKTTLAEALGISESDITETERDGTIALSYGNDGISVDAYIMEDAKAAQDFFSIPAMAGSFDDKRVDEKDRKVWVSETENWATGEIRHNTIAMKDNFIILNIGNDLTPEDIIEIFNLG